MASRSAASRWRHWAILPGMVALLGAAVGPAAAQDRACLQWDEPVTLDGYILDGVFP